MENKRHIQLPNELLKLETIDYKAVLVFLAIRSFYNSTKEYSLVSLDKLKEITGASIPTLRKIIKKLEDAKVILRFFIGKCYAYKLAKKYKHFEPFSYEFLKYKDLNFSQKAYLASIQCKMFKDPNTKTGKVSLSDRELSKTLKTSVDTVKRIDRQLEEKGILITCISKCKDLETKLNKNEKIFDLTKYHQDIVFILKAYGERIIENSEDIKQLQLKVDSYDKMNKFLKEKVKELNNRVKKLEDTNTSKKEYRL